MRTAIVRRDSHKDAIWVILRLGVLYASRSVQLFRYCRCALTHLHKDIPIAILVKRVRVQDFILGHVPAPLLILGHKLLIGEPSLRILVQKLHIRMRRRRIEVVVQLLHVFAMVPLVARDAKQPLLQDRVRIVPQRQAKTQTLMVVGNARQTIFAPPICA